MRFSSISSTEAFSISECVDQRTRNTVLNHSVNKVIIFFVIMLEPIIQPGQGICNVGLPWSVNKLKVISL